MSMKRGNWIPIDRNVIHKLSPTSKDGQYSEWAAYLSLREDLESSDVKGLREYGRIWKWSAKKVFNFFEKIGYKTGFDLEKVRKQFGNNRETDIIIVFNDLDDSKKTIGKQSGNTTNNPNPNPNTLTTFPPNSFEYGVAHHFWKLKLDTHPKAKYAFMVEAEKDGWQKWAGAIDKLIRIDHKSQEAIRKVLRFAVEDEFWKDNLLSLSQLRKKGDHGLTKFEMIQAKMERKPKEKEDHTFIPTYERLVP